jgi:hypothetical protein
MQPQQPSPLNNIIGGLGQGAKGLLQGFGDFVNAQKDTPEGRLLLNNMLAGVTVALGADPVIGANIVQQGQEQFKLGLAKQQKESERQFELEKLGLKQNVEAEKSERKAVLDLQKKGFQQISSQKQRDIPRQYITEVPVGNKKVSFVNQKAYKEDLESANIEFNKTKQAENTFDKAIQNIDELISPKKGKNEYQTTDLGKYLAIESKGVGEVVESPREMFARKFGAKGKSALSSLESLRAKLAFEELRKMREASKTGGALGNVTERELELLQLAGADITEGMSQKEFVERMVRLRNQLTEAKQKLPKSKDEILLQMSGQEMPRIGFTRID